MKHINVDGITFITPLSGSKGEWYYGTDYEHGDLYEAEDQYKAGKPVRGRKLYLVHYPDGTVYCPTPKAAGKYTETPTYYEGAIYIVEVDFQADSIRIIRFDCASHETSIYAEIPLSSVDNCYNMRLESAPLMLTRQSYNHKDFEIVWPERVKFEQNERDSFFLRDGDKLYFSRWHEEGEDIDYKYWTEIVVRNMQGEVIDIFPGDIQIMPNGELWHLN